MSSYYVYVYVDPRNYEEFYYGKGKGSRKDAHLTEESDSEKSKRIQAIKKEGLVPIIRVIAQGLSEHDALLVEKTLLWKLGRNLTNVSSGHYKDNFRPHDKMHVDLTGFDFQNGIYYYNVGEGEHRCWEDYATFGFISAGQGVRWRDAMLGFQAGDVVVAYLKGHGYVGIGKIIEKAKPVREVKINGKELLKQNLNQQWLCRPGCQKIWNSTRRALHDRKTLSGNQMKNLSQILITAAFSAVVSYVAFTFLAAPKQTAKEETVLERIMRTHTLRCESFEEPPFTILDVFV